MFPVLRGRRVSVPPLFLAALATCLVVSACASSAERDRTSVGEGAREAASRTEAGLGDAILSPAEDLNLKRAKIPGVLKRIERIYTPGTALDCAHIENEVKALTQVLGPDDDAPSGDEATASEKAGQEAADATLGAVSGATSGFIPFRSLVRRATGASAHERRLRSAYSTGLQRRAYLKGLGQVQGCAPPAAPSAPKPEEPTIVFRR